MQEDENLVTYITENENTFIAPKGISEQEFDLLAMQTDIDAMKKKLDSLTKSMLKKKEEVSQTAEIEKQVLPEFSMITASGIKTFKDYKLKKRNTIEDSYIFSNGKEELNLPKETYKEIVASKRLKKEYPENTQEYEKLIDSQYERYFMQKENTADNFMHNLSCYCRKEANSPLDAITISRDLISRMDAQEREKTRLLLKQQEREDLTINHILIQTYFDAVKGVPLNRDAVIDKTQGELIAKPFQDTISEHGQFVDRNSTLKIGDTLKNMAFNVPKTFGAGKERLYQDLTLVSASKDSNKIICMDKNQSFYELPRDTVLEQYGKQEKKMQKAQEKNRYRNRMDIGWER